MKKKLQHPESIRTPPYPTHLFWQILEFFFRLTDWLHLPYLLMWLHQRCKPNTRNLTAAEIALARSIFKESIDYHKVRIDEQARIGCRRHHFAYVSFNIINTWGPLAAPHFIHEMVHIWQYQRLGSVYIPRALHAQRTPQGYNYGGIEALQQAAQSGKKFLDFNYEQQGDIIADYFCLRHGYTPRWCQSDPEYVRGFEFWVLGFELVHPLTEV